MPELPGSEEWAKSFHCDTVLRIEPGQSEAWQGGNTATLPTIYTIEIQVTRIQAGFTRLNRPGVAALVSSMINLQPDHRFHNN